VGKTHYESIKKAKFPPIDNKVPLEITVQEITRRRRWLLWLGDKFEALNPEILR
jgi:hypothetical protein